MDIKNTSRLNDLIATYPQLEAVLNQILPELGAIQQHALQANVMQIVSVEHIAQKKNMDVNDILKTLRTAAGLSDSDNEQGMTFKLLDDDPTWIKSEPALVVNGTEMLARGEHPLNLISEKMDQLEAGTYILLVTNFHPHPLIEKMNEKKYSVHSRIDSDDPKIHLTWFGK